MPDYAAHARELVSTCGIESEDFESQCVDWALACGLNADELYGYVLAEVARRAEPENAET